jgi:hypothetical protein
MPKQDFVFIIMICIFVLIIAVALVRINPSAKIKIKKAPILIGLIILLLLLNWRYVQTPYQCYSDGRWGPESPEVAKNLSSDDRMAIVEYIRDHIRGTRHDGNDRTPQPNDTIYIGEAAQSWLAPELMTESQHIYSIHFQNIKAGFVCVGVLHQYSPYYPTRSHGFYHYIWVFEKSFSGKWELFAILPDGIV